MDKRKRERLAERAEVLKAIANPVRLLMLEELGDRKRCVGELAASAGVSVSAASRHLTRMRNAGILESARKDREVYYRLRIQKILAAREAVEAVLVRKTIMYRALCRTEDKKTKMERRVRWGRNILKGRVF